MTGKIIGPALFNPLDKVDGESPVRKKLREMLEEIDLDDYEDDHGSCGHGCSHKHHR